MADLLCEGAVAMVISWMSAFGGGKSTPTDSPIHVVPDGATVGADWRQIEGMSATCQERMEDF